MRSETADQSPEEAREWARIRARLSERADAEGLIDVAVESHDSPLGPLLVAATDAGLVRVGLPADDRDEFLAELAGKISPRVLSAPRASLTDARRQLDQYFNRKRRDFDIELDWQLVGGFRRDVLEATARIPYGRTGTYASVAREAGSPDAVRAAGTALAKNPVPIVVPCHRVLRSDGELGNYRGGVEAKAALLELEARS